MNINEKFAGYMQAVMPHVKPESREWWFLKKGFLGGLGTGLGGANLSLRQKLKLADDMQSFSRRPTSKC